MTIYGFNADGFNAEHWDYVNDEKICDIGLNALPRKDEEIVLYEDDLYWWFVMHVAHIKQDQGTAIETILKPRIYVFPKLKEKDAPQG